MSNFTELFGVNSTVPSAIVASEEHLASSGRPVVMNVTKVAEHNLTLQEDIDMVKHNLNQFFLVIMGSMILFMQSGFAFLECGAVRSKNTTSILIKNLMDTMISSITYFLIGYPLAYGHGNSFLGFDNFAAWNLPDDKYGLWFFHFTFAATAATIVSGAVAERCDFVGYVLYSTCLTGFTYPIVVHWAWSPEGWLAMKGFEDFAGSATVHAVGGTASLIATTMLGPRHDYFDHAGLPRTIKGHSVPMTAFGGFILMFGFLAFNAGSQQAMATPADAYDFSRAVMNTVLCGTTGAFTGLFINRLGCTGNSNWSLSTAINAALAGMVAGCAGCNEYYPWAASFVGATAALSYFITHRLVLNVWKLDDPLEVIGVHLGGGVWGIIAQPIFKGDNGLLYRQNTGSYSTTIHFLWNICGICAILAWTAAICLPVFYLLSYFGVFRVHHTVERKGIDVAKHDPAYPYDSNLITRIRENKDENDSDSDGDDKNDEMERRSLMSGSISFSMPRSKMSLNKGSLSSFKTSQSGFSASKTFTAVEEVDGEDEEAEDEKKKDKEEKKPPPPRQNGTVPNKYSALAVTHIENEHKLVLGNGDIQKPNTQGSLTSLSNALNAIRSAKPGDDIDFVKEKLTSLLTVGNKNHEVFNVTTTVNNPVITTTTKTTETRSGSAQRSVGKESIPQNDPIKDDKPEQAAVTIPEKQETVERKEDRKEDRREDRSAERTLRAATPRPVNTPQHDATNTIQAHPTRPVRQKSRDPPVVPVVPGTPARSPIRRRPVVHKVPAARVAPRAPRQAKEQVMNYLSKMKSGESNQPGENETVHKSSLDVSVDPDEYHYDYYDLGGRGFPRRRVVAPPRVGRRTNKVNTLVSRQLDVAIKNLE